VAKQLPPRPDLDHLRKQAKVLLAGIEKGEPDAIACMRQHLPAANSLSDAQIRSARYRLADAQSAIARKTGFASWPALARHVEQLRALEGTWEFLALEVDGRAVPAAMLATSRILIDGDRFRSETPGAVYEGLFNIDVEAQPHGIDIHFVTGPEAGHANFGIFRLDGSDALSICLDMSGKSRPKAFKTSPASSHALETLRRSSSARPQDVNGGTAPRPEPPDATLSPSDFQFTPSETLTRLQGEWSCVQLIQDGREMPAFIRSTAKRIARSNELKITIGGQLIIHALVRINEATAPMQIDYLHQSGPAQGTIQHGIMKWEGDDTCFCMSAPQMQRPTDFACVPGSANTMSQWRKVK
jgi:uncharacterized protein (TIGR03067 family)